MSKSLFQVVFPSADPSATGSEVTFSTLPERGGKFTLVAQGTIRGHLVFAEVPGCDGADFLEVVLAHGPAVSARLEREVAAGMPAGVLAQLN